MPWATTLDLKATPPPTLCVTVSNTTDVLIIADMQVDFLTPGGSLHVKGGEALLDGINAVSSQLPFRYQVATQDWHPENHCSFVTHGGPWPPHCVQGSSGAQLHAGLHTHRINAVLRKGATQQADSYSAFVDDNGVSTGLAGLLHSIGARRVFVCGVAYDFCVFFTAMDARKNGFGVVLLEDLTAAVDDAAWSARAAELKEAGVVLLSSSALVAEGTET
ncbi:alpha/beta-hydrolase-like protein [Leishmania major strain Friedlin]|uniref:nicotinamidase n=1 Tax=Leishmania major TaxID=5664 RepID=E9AC36_LEIMA|nr:alpha/beta-hydrolase-like protein [Leishmania major strain Friedlin]CAG9567110.1 nicotinamidase_-_putative [Leishmania major strain Friedlin]CBZ11850.1 alpha/beta-hydrolase-like protein [Leishmania major strain Friedlin]|eukprot:XP_003721567.1 alpha/beta-hydrolase-like protein [Leishmania major strain Friedlin]